MHAVAKSNWTSLLMSQENSSYPLFMSELMLLRTEICCVGYRKLSAPLLASGATLPELFEAQVARDADAVALIFDSAVA